MMSFDDFTLKNGHIRLTKITRDGPTDRRTDGQTDGRTDGRTNGHDLDAYLHLKSNSYIHGPYQLSSTSAFSTGHNSVLLHMSALL